MMKEHIYLWALVVALLGATACSPQPPAEEEAEQHHTPAEIAQESKKANDYFEKMFNEWVSRHPEMQAYLGIKEDYDQWEDISLEYKAQEIELAKQQLQWLKDSIHYDALSPQVKISYDLAVQKAEEDIEGFKYELYDYPVNQMFGKHSDAPAFLINIHQITDKADAEAYISRVEKIAPLFDQLITNLKLREEKGIMPPKFVFDKVISGCKKVISGEPFEAGEPSTILADFTGKVDALKLEEAESTMLKNQVTTALLNSVKPAYEGLIAYLSEQQQRATTDDGAWKFPDGAGFYNYALRKTTTTGLTADEIHETGLKEVARIHGEMRGIMKKVGFEGDLQAFFEFMRTDKQFYYPDTEAGKQAYLDSAVAIIDNMRGRLDELFITKPKAEIEVKAVEPFREKSAGKAFYQQPAPDGSRPGKYYANLYDMKTMPKYQMEALAYHEGIPGHHMQIAIGQELKGVPKFRKFGNYTAYAEGWGLYCEFIPKELGLYADPYADFGRLAMELWRACRLVVDTGIHAKKWTREQGIAYYKENTPDAEEDCIRMVERHIVMPSQATAYKIGMLKIIELREKAKAALGDQFDIREYHDVVLTNGAVPLSMLEKLVDEWIASKSV